MSRCVLGSGPGALEYEYNAPEHTNPLVRVVVPTETLQGRYYTDWGSDVSRREISQSWPAMDAAFFEALKAKAAAGGVQSFLDDDGTPYTVVVMAPNYQRRSPGGDGYLGVTLRLMVVSSP